MTTREAIVHFEVLLSEMKKQTWENTKYIEAIEAGYNALLNQEKLEDYIEDYTRYGGRIPNPFFEEEEIEE